MKTTSFNEPVILNGVTLTRRCPNCGKTKPLMQDFGLRRLRGVLTNQSWCVTCRSAYKTLVEG